MLGSTLAHRSEPYGDKLFVRPLRTSYRMQGSIVPDTVAQWIPPTQGLVLRVGPRVNGVRPGDKVLYGLGVGTLLDHGLLVIETEDVICRM
jgi:hypothetical protein